MTSDCAPVISARPDLVLVEVSEEREHEEDVRLRDDEVLEHVVELPVAELMAQDGQDLRRGAALGAVGRVLLALLLELLGGEEGWKGRREETDVMELFSST